MGGRRGGRGHQGRGHQSGGRGGGQLSPDPYRHTADAHAHLAAVGQHHAAAAPLHAAAAPHHAAAAPYHAAAAPHHAAAAPYHAAAPSAAEWIQAPDAPPRQIEFRCDEMEEFNGKYDIDPAYGILSGCPTWTRVQTKYLGLGTSVLYRLYRDRFQCWCITNDPLDPRAGGRPSLRSADSQGLQWNVWRDAWHPTSAVLSFGETADNGLGDLGAFDLDPLARWVRAMMSTARTRDAVQWVFDWCRRLPAKAEVRKWQIMTNDTVQGRRVCRCAADFIATVRRELHTVDRRGPALHAVAVALAADCAVERMDRDVPAKGRCDMPELTRKLAQEREALMRACMDIVAEVSRMPEIPPLNWDALRQFSQHLDGAPRGAELRASVGRLCEGVDAGLRNIVPRGEAGAPVIRVLAELCVCFTGRRRPPSWNEARRNFTDWSTAILMYCTKVYPVSLCSPQNARNDFSDLFKCIWGEGKITLECLLELLENDRECGEDKFKPRGVVLDCLEPLSRGHHSTFGASYLRLCPGAGDSIRFYGLLPAHLRDLALAQRIKALVPEFDKNAQARGRLNDLCDEQAVTDLCVRYHVSPACAPEIVRTARRIILDLPLHQSNATLAAAVLHAEQQSGMDIDTHLEQKAASREQQTPAVFVGVVGALLQRGATIEMDRFVNTLFGMARARGDHAPLELCRITAHRDALHWDEPSALTLQTAISRFVADWKPTKARGFLCRDATDFINDQSVGSSEEGGALWRAAWRSLVERLFFGDAAVEQAGQGPPKQTTTCPMFADPRAVDKWLLGKPVELRYVVQRPGARSWAAVTLLKAFLSQAAIPRLEPRVESRGTRRPRTAVDRDLAELFVAAGIEQEWNLFQVANQECFEQVKRRVRDDAISRQEVAQLEESQLAEEALLVPVQWRATHDQETDELKRLQAVLRTFEHNWHVEGLAGVLADVDQALTRAEEVSLADLTRLRDRVRKAFPNRVDALERASHSKYFMRHYARHKEQGRRVSLEEFKRLMDNVFDTLRGFSHQSTVDEVLLPTELDLGDLVGRLMSEEDARKEKEFLTRDVGCDAGVAALLVDHAAPLVTKNLLLRPVQDFCRGNASAELRTRPDFVVQEDRAVLNQTLDGIRALSLEEARRANDQLQRATQRCSVYALQLIARIIDCPGLVSFLLNCPASINPDLQRQFKNSHSHQQALAQFMAFRQIAEALKPFVASLAKFDEVSFQPYGMRALDSRGFFKAWSTVPGLRTEQGLTTAIQNIEQLSSKKVLRTLEDLVLDNLVSADQRAADFCAEFFQSGTVEFDFTKKVDTAGSFMCRCTLGDGSEKEIDYNTFRNHYNAATQHRHSNEVLDEFSKMGYDFLHLYFMAAQLARDGHIRVCGRRFIYSARRAKDRGLRDVVKIFEGLRPAWRAALNEAAVHAPPLSLLSSPQLVCLADLLCSGIPTTAEEEAAQQRTLCRAWHVITTLGADKTRGEFDEMRARHSPGDAARQVVLGEDTWDHPEAFEQSTKAVLRRVGDFLGAIGITGSAPAPAPLAGVEEGAYLFHISRMPPNHQRQFAESRLTDLRAHFWLECKRTTTMEQVDTFVRRFEVIPRGCMVVLHFQLLPTDAQKAFHSAAHHNSRLKRLFLFVTDEKHAGGAVDKTLHITERAAMEKDLCDRACIKSVHWHQGPTGCGKSSAINAAIHEHGRRPARVDLDASTSLDAVCRKLVEIVPWGSGGGEGVGDLVLHVGHDADLELVNAVLDGLILFGALESPAGTTCAASALRGWTVHIELQERCPRAWPRGVANEISVLQMRKLATQHGPLSPEHPYPRFRIDFVDPLTSPEPRLPPPLQAPYTVNSPDPPGTVDAIKALREWYKPDTGGWINGPTGEPCADALYQLLRMAGNTQPTPRQLEKAALYLTHRYRDMQKNQFLRDLYAQMQFDPATAQQGVRHLETFFARCLVHGLLQHLRQHGEADFHLCASKHTFLALRGDLPAEIKAAADGFNFVIEHCADDRVPLYRLVNVLASELDAVPKLVADAMRQLNFILTPDILKKMLNLEQHIGEGVPMILEGPSGTGKTYAVRMRAALELLSRRHKHNALLPNLAKFLQNSAALKECFAAHVCPGAARGTCKDGPHPTSLKADELAALGIAGLAEQNPRNLQRHGGELDDCIGMVHGLDDWTGLFCILDRLQQHEGREPALARELVDGVRRVLHGALEHHFVTDQKLCAHAEKELPHVARAFGTGLTLAQHREVLGRSLQREGGANLAQCVGVMKGLIKCTGYVGMSYLTTSILSALHPHIIEKVKPRVPGLATEIEKRLETDNMSRVLAFWARSAVQRMGDKARQGVEIVRAQLQAMIEDMPLAKTTELFDRHVKQVPEDADLTQYFEELLCEFAKTTAKSNYLQVHMRHEFSPAELYDEMKDFFQRAAASKERFFAFIDEMNTSPWMGMLKRIVVDKYWDLWPGGHLPSNITFVCAINPRDRDDSLEHSGEGGRGVQQPDVRWALRELEGRVDEKRVRHALCLFPEDKWRARDYLKALCQSTRTRGADEATEQDRSYDVNELPPAAREFVVPWAQLTGAGRVTFIIAKLFSNKTLAGHGVEREAMEALANMLLAAHDAVQRMLLVRRSRATVSQRDIHRALIFFDDFFERDHSGPAAAGRAVPERALAAMIPAVAMSYYFRLVAEDRAVLCEKIDEVIRNSPALSRHCPAAGVEDGPGVLGGLFSGRQQQQRARSYSRAVIEGTVCQYFDGMGSVGDGIYPHMPLKEILFVQTVCIHNRVGVVLLGAPGTGKTQSTSMIESVCQGKTDLMNKLTWVADVLRYQGSKQSSPDEIRQKCEEATKLQQAEDARAEADDAKGKAILLLVDEAGIVSSGNKMGLKVLHYYLEFMGQKGIAAVLPTNDPLDPAVSNRCVEVLLPATTAEEMVNISVCLCSAGRPEPPPETTRILRACVDAYRRIEAHGELCFAEGRPRFGLRDLYSFMRFLARKDEFARGDVMDRKAGTCVTVTPLLLLRALEQNFNAVPEQFETVCRIFQEECNKAGWAALPKDFFLDSGNRRNRLAVLVDALRDNNRARPGNMRNINDSWVRFKMLEDHTPDGSALSLLTESGLADFRDIQVLSLSALSEDDSLMEVRVVSELAAAMQAGKTVWLTHTRAIDGCLYSVFNQKYDCIELPPAPGKDPEVACFVGLGVGGLVDQKRVHPNFQVIVHVTPEEAKTLPTPFHNRLEKFALHVPDVLAYQKAQLREDMRRKLEAAEQCGREFMDHINAAERTVFTQEKEDTLAAMSLGFIRRVGETEVTLKVGTQLSSAARALVAAGAPPPSDAPDPEAHRLWLELAAQILGICRPEGMILAEEGLHHAKHYLVAYLSGPSCSLKRCIRLAAGVETQPGVGHSDGQVADDDGDTPMEQEGSEQSAAEPQWKLFTVHVPANTEFRRVIGSECADVADYVGLDSVGRVENLEERIRHFANDPHSRVLVVDASGKGDAAVREARQLTRRPPHQPSGAKAIILLRPFQPEKFETARTPLPGGEWTELYVDAAADNEGIDLAHYAGVADTPGGGPGLPDRRAAIVEALEPIAFAIPETGHLDAVLRKDREVPDDTHIARNMKFYITQETVPTFRASKLTEIFDRFPLLWEAVANKFRSVMSPEEMCNYARTASKKVCAPDGTRNLAKALRGDPTTVLARIIQVALGSILLVDLNIVSMGTLIHDEGEDVLQAIDALLGRLLADELRGLSAEDLRNSRPLARPIAIGGTVPYLPGFSQIAKRMPVAPGTRAEEAARELERVTKGCKVCAGITGHGQLRARFWRCCVRERVRLVRTDKQDDVVEGCLALVNSLHDATFGAGTMTIERCRAVCSSYAPLIEAFALGLIQLAECGALTDDATSDLQEKVEEVTQGPEDGRQAELRRTLGQWVCDLLRETWEAKADAADAMDNDAAPRKADLLSLCTATLALLVVPEGAALSELHGLLGGLPDCTRLPVLAAAVHADQSPGVLTAASAYASLDPDHADVSGAFDRLCACGPAVAGAVLEQYIRCCKQAEGDTAALYGAVLLQLAKGRVRGQMTPRILAMLPQPPKEALSDAWDGVWRLVGGGDEAGDFPAPDGAPLSNPAFVAVYDVLYDRLTEAHGDALGAAVDRLQEAEQEMAGWQQQGAPHMVAVCTAEGRASEAAIVSILSNTLASQGPTKLLDLGREGLGPIGDTVKRLMNDAKYRAHFAEELRRATQADGGVMRLTALLTDPETRRRLALMNEQLHADCGEAPARVVVPGDWPCISDEQDEYHHAAVEILQAVAKGAAKRAPAEAARCVVEAVEDVLPDATPGLRRALVGWCASRSRRRNRVALPAAAATDTALAAALDLNPEGNPSATASQRIMMLLFAGPHNVPGVPPCAYVESIGEFEAWEAAAESVLAAALSCDPESALHSMLLAPDALRNTIILGDPYARVLGGADINHRGSLDCSIRIEADGHIVEGGRPGGTGAQWADGACYLLWYVVLTLLAHSAIINPPARPNTEDDFLWRHVFSAVATGELDGAEQRRVRGDARRKFNDFVLNYSRTTFANLTAGGRGGLNYDEALRSIAATCWWIASEGDGSIPLRRHVATTRDKEEAERAFYKLWKRMTVAERGHMLGNPAEAEAAGGPGDERVRRPPGRREATREFEVVSQLYPALRQANQEERRLRHTVPLYVRLIHVLHWICSTYSGTLPVEDYRKSLALLAYEDDQRRGLRPDSPTSAVRLWHLLRDAWNSYLRDCGPIVNTCQGDSIAWGLTEDTPISTFLHLPEDQELVGGHTNYMKLAVEALHREVNRMVAEAAGIESAEEYSAQWDHPMLHPLLLPTSEQPFVKRPVGDVSGMLLGSCVGPGTRFNFEAAEREARRRGGDGLPLLLNPGLSYFQFKKTEIITDDCERVARELRGRISTLPRTRVAAAPADLEFTLRKNFHKGFSERDALATSAAVLQLLSAQGDRKRKLGTTLAKLLPDGGGDQGLHVRLVLWADGATVANAPLLATILAEKLETRDWDPQLPFAMAHPLAPAAAAEIRRKVEAWAPGGARAPQSHGTLESQHAVVCSELRALDAYMEHSERTLCGAMLDEAQEEAEMHQGKAPQGKGARRVAHTPLMEWLCARAQRDGRPLRIASCFGTVLCSSYAPIRRLVRHLVHEAEERGRNPCVRQWRDNVRVEEPPEEEPPAAGEPNVQHTAEEPDEMGEAARPKRGRESPPAAPGHKRGRAASAEGKRRRQEAPGKRSRTASPPCSGSERRQRGVVGGESRSESPASAWHSVPRSRGAASSPVRSAGRLSRPTSTEAFPPPPAADFPPPPAELFPGSPRDGDASAAAESDVMSGASSAGEEPPEEGAPDCASDGFPGGAAGGGAGDAPGGARADAEGMQGVRDLLRHQKHPEYAAVFEEMGYDTVEILAETSPEELEADCGVKRVHARRIVTEARCRAAAASGALPAPPAHNRARAAGRSRTEVVPIRAGRRDRTGGPPRS
eukprot:TRINITY_DN3275_c0_g1_i3.p1 TRINITY_DN3275_c0_g1~~TRINITY_DN3275_c0_g1_i3.p1  ORF type:complete len:5465 (+),score=1200.30 TRINITY_DN3275_c0_g1_i3:125-16519(+)